MKLEFEGLLDDLEVEKKLRKVPGMFCNPRRFNVTR
jgi:hypothetical protein